MERKMKHQEEILAKRMKRKEAFTEEIVFHGLWQSIDDVDRKLAAIPGKQKKVKALKGQLNFRQHVFEQAISDKTVYVFSRKLPSGKRSDLQVKELCKPEETCSERVLLSTGSRQDISMQSSGWQNCASQLCRERL